MSRKPLRPARPSAPTASPQLAGDGGGFRSRIRVGKLTASGLSEWRWRLAGVALVVAYIAQDAMGLRWEWLRGLQAIDGFKYATGACLLSYVGWQWYLFVARLKKKRLRLLMPLHQRSGALVPVLFYVHSVEIGYGYMAALSWIFLGNMVVGAASPVGFRVRSRRYITSWGAIHVTLAALTVVLALLHAYIALYYK